jgi:hypothetical protein
LAFQDNNKCNFRDATVLCFRLHHCLLLFSSIAKKRNSKFTSVTSATSVNDMASRKIDGWLPANHTTTPTHIPTHTPAHPLHNTNHPPPSPTPPWQQPSL